jgi:hypothetical protein
MTARDMTSARFANWRIIPMVDDGRIHIQRGLMGKPLAALTPADARELADVLVLAAQRLEQEIKAA